MKKIIFSLIVSITLFSIATAQTTATNFNVSDCAGNPHNLFSELDAGKIIVMAWVMPCGSCGVPAKAAFDAVQTFSTSHPGIVKFYLIDDYANTNCTSLTNWGNTNGMSGATVFSNAAISMTDYGTPGMPKIVVLGNSTHAIYMNLNSGVNQTNVQAAINTAINASPSLINENVVNILNLKMYPCPTKDKIEITYNLISSPSVSIEITNVLGEIVKQLTINQNSIGKNAATVDLSELNNGNYFITLYSENMHETKKITLVK